MQRIRQRRERRRSGYTLLEVLIVVAIIALIAAMVVPNLLGTLGGANKQVTKAEIDRLEGIFNVFAVQNQGKFPSGGNEVFEQLILPGTDPVTGSELPPLLDEIPTDAWGQPLNYEYPNTKSSADKPALWSNGQDGVDDNGANDDINNWSDLSV
jgi:general secretion pathway protein G